MNEQQRKKWIEAVSSGVAENVRDVLNAYPELRAHVNDQVFSFDSSAVFEARQKIEVIDVLLEYGADLNQKTGWWAGGFGILEGVDANVAEALIARGAIVDIWAAVSLNKVDRVVELLDQDPSLVTARGGDGKHPLHYAQDPQMVDLLVSRGADVNAEDVDHRSTPVQYLVKNEAVVRRLLHHGAKADIFLAAALGDLSLVRACVADDPECTEGRIGVGRWTNTVGGHFYNWSLGHDQTPMDVALARGHDGILVELLSHASAATQLSHAIWHDDDESITQLVSSNPDCVDQLKTRDPELLARASWEHRPGAVKRLLQIGFDPHVTGVHNSTPLDRAAFHGYVDIVALLLRR